MRTVYLWEKRRLQAGLVCWLLVIGWLGRAAPNVRADDWPRFRGPNGVGVSSLRVEPQWTQESFRWIRELPGEGHASPVVWGNQLYVLSAIPESGTRIAIAMDVRDGRIVWQREFPSQTHHLHARSSYASSTPAVDERGVYFTWATPEETVLVALNHVGELTWRRDFGTFRSDHGFGSSPIVFNNLVILPLLQMKPDENGPSDQSSQVIAVDHATGETRWSTPRTSDVVSYSTPCIFTPPQGAPQVIGCSTADGMFSLDAQTGAPRWSVPVFDMRTVSSPVVANSLIFGSTGSGGGGNYVVAVKPTASADTTPEIAYHVRKQAPYVPTPVALGDLIFLWFEKGIVSCLRAADGTVVWQERVGGNYSSSPVIVGDHLMCVDDEGTVVVLSATAQYQLLGKNPLGRPSRSTPAIAQGHVFFRTYSHIYCLPGQPESAAP